MPIRSCRVIAVAIDGALAAAPSQAPAPWSLFHVRIEVPFVLSFDHAPAAVHLVSLLW